MVTFKTWPFVKNPMAQPCSHGPIRNVQMVVNVVVIVVVEDIIIILSVLIDYYPLWMIEIDLYWILSLNSSLSLTSYLTENTLGNHTSHSWSPPLFPLHAYLNGKTAGNHGSIGYNKRRPSRNNLAKSHFYGLV